ncbi:MAG: dCTP deaminase [Sphaerospermopsis sp. SIO1G1]|nr:dCTP deaminase [Sphaerospermopsis sp. SIO1G1]
MIKNDIWIAEMAQKGMIAPFEPSLIRHAQDLPVISYGLSSFGYDIRLSANDFRIFRHIPGTVVDPKNFNPDNLEPTQLHTDENGSYFILPAHSYGLGVALEKLEIPDNITVICIGKSTYARCFRGDTRVALVDGTSPTLEEMAKRSENGEKFWGYSIGQYGRIIVTLLESPRYIGRDSLLEVTLDNQESIFCTPDHLFMTRDGRMVEAHNLKPQDSLMPLYRQIARGYEMVYQPLNGHLYPTHRLSDEWNLYHGIYDDIPNTHRHHVDFSRLNNNPWNIIRMDASKTRHDITAEVLRSALEQTGSIRGAAKLLNCDRYVFRRFPEVMQAFRGLPQNHSLKNHKVVSVKDVPGIHDVYCLTVPEAGNFALESGVFVHNCGIIANVTPAEAAWRGYLTLEFSNASSADCRIYANEGIVQLMFFEGEPCSVSYESRQGKYQDQLDVVTLARV